MKIFLDSANLKEIESVRGFIDGVTTNPTLVANELGARDKKSVYGYYQKILGLVNGPVSLEVTEDIFEGMKAQAEELFNLGKNVVVKVPVTSDGLRVVKELDDGLVKFNVTLVMNVYQAIAAANAGATYVSPFWGRIDDYALNDPTENFPRGLEIISGIKAVFNNNSEIYTKVLAASIRNIGQVKDAIGIADCITVPYAILQQMITHPKTNEGLKKFMDDWRANG